MKMFIDVIILIFITSFFSRVDVVSSEIEILRLVWQCLSCACQERVYMNTEECLGRRRWAGWVLGKEPWLSGWAGQSAPWVWSPGAVLQAFWKHM